MSPNEKKGLSIFVAIATVLLFVATLYTSLTGEGLTDLFLNFVEVLLFAATLGGVGYLVAHIPAMLGRKEKRETFARKLAILLIVFIVGAHVVMDIKVAPLRRAFYTRAEKGSDGGLTENSESGGHNEGPQYERSFGGDLDSIVAQRKALYKKNGFVLLGSWDAGDRGSSACGLNLYWPFNSDD
jgi:hypothetical protein